ncbi:uncharacterized protein LOC120067610 [Benincasa hispida]|uniref:uncharacterized protein LOC120067610 n=1 Tax=Benincasa hispida TaxID=102211 RepID=UPI00190007B5|nr:uncharacterized protein LOC120067610 [Benincasa hispida]
MGHQTTKKLWEDVKELVGVQSRAETDYLKRMFQQTRKATLKMSEYLTLTKKYADNLAFAGPPMSPPDLISQVLSGLDEEYNPVVVAVKSKGTTRWSDLQSDLLSYEKRLEYQLAIKTNITGMTNVSISSNSPSVNVVQNSPSTLSNPYRNSYGNNQSSNYRGGEEEIKGAVDGTMPLQPGLPAKLVER